MNFLLSILITLIVMSIIKYIFFTKNSNNGDLLCDDDEDEDSDLDLQIIQAQKHPNKNSNNSDPTCDDDSDDSNLQIVKARKYPTNANKKINLITNSECPANEGAKDYLNNFIHENFKINISHLHSLDI